MGYVKANRNKRRMYEGRSHYPRRGMELGESSEAIEAVEDALDVISDMAFSVKEIKRELLEIAEDRRMNPWQSPEDITAPVKGLRKELKDLEKSVGRIDWDALK